MKFNTGAIFAIFTAVTFYGGSVTAADSESPKSFEDVFRAQMAKFPVYTAVYNAKPGDPEVLAEIEEIIDNEPIINPDGHEIHPVNIFPNLRSPLHRAIEKMDANMVRLLLNNNAHVLYGYDFKEDGTRTLLRKPDANKPPHLVGHLEEFYNGHPEADYTPEFKKQAKKILTALYDANLNVAEWPAEKDSRFAKLRKKWAKDGGIVDLAIKETSSVGDVDDEYGHVGHRTASTATASGIEPVLHVDESDDDDDEI